MGPPCRIDLTTHRTMSERSYHGATSRSNIDDDNGYENHNEGTNTYENTINTTLTNI